MKKRMGIGRVRNKSWHTGEGLRQKNRQKGKGWLALFAVVSLIQCGLIQEIAVWARPGLVQEEERYLISEQSVRDADPPEEAKLYAKAAALLDGDTGRVLYGKNADLPLPMASTTKIMTCIIALEYGNLDDVYTVSSYAASMPQVKAGYRVQEQYRLEDLLYALMLESHNDAAVVIAEGVAGSVEGFAALMNRKAEELGCEATHFVTPNGLDADGHQTTAAELGRIAAYALKNETFCQIIQTRNHIYTDVNGQNSRTIANKNAFLDQYEGCIGIKTGYTGKAGYCYVGCARREGVTLIGVVLASGWPPHKTYKWSDCRQLLDYGFAAFEKRQIVQPQYHIRTLPVENGIGDQVTVSMPGELTLLVSGKEQISLRYDLPEVLEAPVQKGEEVGTASLFIDEELYGTFPVVTDEGVEEFTFVYALDRVLDLFLGMETGSESIKNK